MTNVKIKVGILDNEIRFIVCKIEGVHLIDDDDNDGVCLL